MGFTSSWCTQRLGNLKWVFIVRVDTTPRESKWGLIRLGGHSCLGTYMGFTSFWWTQGLGDLNGVYIVLVDTGSWGPKWGVLGCPGC
jgi:hypothetical protein